LSDAPFLEPGQALRDLKALEAIEERPDISQRDMALRLGIALGLTNACLSRMARTGLIKIRRVNSRNLTYHLTPAGIAAKARLSMQYTRRTIDLYRTARQAVTERLSTLAEDGVAKIGVLGANDVAEIVGVVCAHSGVEIISIADQNSELVGTRFMGRVVGTVTDLETAGCEAVIVAYLDDTEVWVQHLRTVLPDRVTVLAAL
jgi:DNA-binding MarR family transcriptional regulator